MKRLATLGLLAAAAAPRLAAQQPRTPCHADTLGVDTTVETIYAFGPNRALVSGPERGFVLAQADSVLRRVHPIGIVGPPDRPPDVNDSFGDSTFAGAEAVVWFQVRNDGRLSGMHVERHSRYNAVNLTLQRAILEADSEHALLPLTGPLRNMAVDLYVGAGHKAAVHGDSAVLSERRRIEARMNEKPPRFLRYSYRPRYPRVAQEAGIGDTLVADFVIDSTGHVEPQSFRYIRGTYREFADEARRAILGAVYEPATAGGCPIAKRVQQPVNFSVERRF